MNTVGADGVVSVTTDITDGLLTFGVELKSYQSNDCKFDHFTIEYIGQGVETAVTAVSTSTTTNARNLIYDLSGRRRSRLHKGLNIVGDRKVVVK